VLLEIELALRFLRRRRGLLLRGTSLAALAGVALATAALVVTLALMRGYTDAIAVALQRGNAHLVGFLPTGLSLAEAGSVAAELAAVEGVVAARPVTYLPGLLDDPAEPAHPLPVTLKAVAEPPAFTGLDRWPAASSIPVVLGARLAEAVGVTGGERLSLRLPPKAGAWVVPSLTLEAVGTFRLEFAEFDRHWLVAPLAAVLEAFPETRVAGIEVVLHDPMAVESTRLRLEHVDRRLLFTDWREMNRSLFAALRWQTLSLFVVLGLVVAVASFQVASALVVLSIEKRRSAGVLQALGSTPGAVLRVMLSAGIMLGGAGVACGIALGSVISWVLTATRLVRFPEGLARVYMVDSIPFEIAVSDLGAVLALCLTLVALASVAPAWRTSRLDPVAALKAV
jgi:lipoprotein-releasing system permease protein